MPTKSYISQVKPLKGFILLLGLLLIQPSFGQSIRKGFDEMTDYEISELVDAFYELRNGPDLFNDLSTFHGDFFNFDNTADPTRLDLHFNLPGEPEREIFLAWHRRQMFEMEQAVQEINPEISLGYWNSITYQTSTDALWDQDFLGSFDANWSWEEIWGAMDQCHPSRIWMIYWPRPTFLFFPIFWNEGMCTVVPTFGLVEQCLPHYHLGIRFSTSTTHM